MKKRNYRTDEEWLSLIQECRSSGLMDKQWCEAHLICPSINHGDRDAGPFIGYAGSFSVPAGVLLIISIR